MNMWPLSHYFAKSFTYILFYSITLIKSSPWIWLVSGITTYLSVHWDIFQTSCVLKFLVVGKDVEDSSDENEFDEIDEEIVDDRQVNDSDENEAESDDDDEEEEDDDDDVDDENLEEEEEEEVDDKDSKKRKLKPDQFESDKSPSKSVFIASPPIRLIFK